MTSITEWFAGVVAVAIVLKFLAFYFAPKSLDKMAISMINNKGFSAVYLTLTALLSWLVILEVGAITFAAAILPVAAFYGYFFLQFPKEMKSITKRITKNRTIAWPAWALALILAFIVLRVLFF